MQLEGKEQRAFDAGKAISAVILLIPSQIISIRLKELALLMRIALFTETFIPKVDGIVTTLCQTVKQLESLGHQVLIFAPEGGFDSFQQSRIVGSKGHAVFFYPELRLALPRASMYRAIADFEPDLIHVADPAFLGMAGVYLGGGKNGGVLRLPLVISYHTDLAKYLHYYPLGFMEPLAWPILRWRHHRATLNLCTSAAMVDQLGAHGIGHLGLWPGGVDTELFQPSRRSSAMRARLTEGHPESPLLLYVGRLSAEKEIERLRPILQALPDARLALVGDGPNHESLQRHFAGMPVHMAGYLRGEELAQAFASSDVFVMTSRTETLGLVILEAMSSGLPVVAARAGGIPELIADGVNGYLFDDESQAIAAIRQLLPSPEKREAIGQAARAQACQFGWKAATLQLLDHYQTACRHQHIARKHAPNSARPNLRSRAGKGIRAATLFTLRKILP
jgi:glycosyltransferase involved in cell wall biosynthesis